MGSYIARIPGIPDLTDDEKEEIREYLLTNNVLDKPMSFFNETAYHFQKKFNKTVVEGHIQRQFCELLVQGKLDVDLDVCWLDNESINIRRRNNNDN